MAERNTYSVPRPQRHFAPGPGRLLTGSNNVVARRLATGTTNTTFHSGDGTCQNQTTWMMVAVIRTHFLAGAGSASDYLSVLGGDFLPSSAFGINTSSQLTSTVSGSGVVTTTNLIPTQRWTMIAVEKAAGAFTPRGHIYDPVSNVWTHQNMSGSQNNPTNVPSNIGPIANGSVLGSYQNSDLAVLAFFNGTFANDAFIESFSTNWGTQDIAQFGPKGLWQFNQTNPWTNHIPNGTEMVNNLAARGQDQSGLGGGFPIFDGPERDGVGWTYLANPVTEFAGQVPQLITSAGGWR